MRVLRILTRGNVGGPMRQALDLWRQDPVVGMQTLVVVGTCGAGETEMEFGALPVIESAAVTPAARGLTRVTRLGRTTRLFRDLLAVRELRQLIRRFRPDVVHTHTSQAGFFGRKAALAEGVPAVVHTFHGHVLADYYSRPVNALFRHLEARLARRTDRLLAISESCREELHGMGIGGGRIEVIPPALDLAPFARTTRAAARRALGCRSDDFVVGLVGRLVPVKRPELFARLLAGVSGARGEVFGDGPLAGELRGRPNITLRGAVPDLHRYLAGLDALVLCSRREGCPLVALEAFAAGVPVVGLDVPGVHDALALWGDGLLVPEHEGIDGLARALEVLRREPDSARDRVAAARRGLLRFRPDRVAARLREHYAEAGAMAVEASPPRG